MAAFADEVGYHGLAAGLVYQAKQRLAAIRALMWDDASGQWRDLVLGAPDGADEASTDASAQYSEDEDAGSEDYSATDSAEDSAGTDGGEEEEEEEEPVYSAASGGFRQSPVLAASNWVPLYCGCAAAGSAQAAAAVASLRGSGLIREAGVAVSLRETGQQWDWPNAWPPITCMLVEGCQKYGGEAGAQVRQACRNVLATGRRSWLYAAAA